VISAKADVNKPIKPLRMERAHTASKNNQVAHYLNGAKVQNMNEK
jgi:hypothetical protein